MHLARRSTRVWKTYWQLDSTGKLQDSNLGEDIPDNFGYHGGRALDCKILKHCDEYFGADSQLLAPWPCRGTSAHQGSRLVRNVLTGNHERSVAEEKIMEGLQQE